MGEFLESPAYYCSLKILKREEERSKKSEGEVTLGLEGTLPHKAVP